MWRGLHKCCFNDKLFSSNQVIWNLTKVVLLLRPAFTTNRIKTFTTMFKRTNTCLSRAGNMSSAWPRGAVPPTQTCMKGAVFGPWAYFSTSSVKSAERVLSRRRQERQQETELWQMTSHDFTVSDPVRQLMPPGKWRVLTEVYEQETKKRQWWERI